MPGMSFRHADTVGGAQAPTPILACLALLLLASLPSVGCGADRPNVILVVVDDLGWADTGAYGSRYHRTPAIDALAASGVRFTDAYAAAPVCSPTRASLLTGLAPARLALTEWLPGPPADGHRLGPAEFVAALPVEQPTLAERLRAAGYATAHIGKWHLGGAGFGPREQGFELNVAGDDAGTPRSYFHPYRDAGGQMPGLQSGAPGEYLTDRLTDEAERFIEQHRDRPFFLQLAHYAVHIPLAAKPEILARYRAAPRPATGQRNPVYAAMIESVDQSVGRLVATLARLGVAERTLLVLTSDNGGLDVRQGPDTPATDNAPLRAGKGHLYEGGIRVPLVVAWPGVIRAGGIESTPAISTDFYATVLDLVGAGAAASADGTSLAPLLRGQGALPTRRLYWHYPHWSGQGGRPGGAVRSGHYKLIEFYDAGAPELYDLGADPGEARDLAAARPELARELQRDLAAWRAQVGARPMRPAPWWRFWASDR